MVGVLYKPPHQQATTARSDRQGQPSPTSSTGTVVNNFHPFIIVFVYCTTVINTGSSPSTVNCVINWAAPIRDIIIIRYAY